MEWREVALIVFRALVKIGKVLLGLDEKKGGEE